MATFLNATLQDGPFKGWTVGEYLARGETVYMEGPHKGRTVKEVAEERIRNENERISRT